jgi:hypothetical protein
MPSIDGDFGSLDWRKAQHSVNNGECVELATPATGKIVIRDSKDPHGPVLMYSAAEWQAFLVRAKKGEFDHLR